MSGAAIFLYPVLVVLVVGAAGAIWQARNPRREIEARSRLIDLDVQAPNWKRLPQWQEYRDQQDDPARFARAARRRAIVFGVGAMGVAIAIALGD